MKRALVIGDHAFTIRRLLDAGYYVIAMSERQPVEFPLPIKPEYRADVPSPIKPEYLPPIAHENLRWHCLDVTDDRYLYGIANALEGAPVDVAVYLAGPEDFAAVRDASGHLWGYACVGPAEVSMLLKGLEAEIQMGGASRG